MFSTELLQDYLKTEFLGHQINYKAATKSTNEDAWEQIKDGCEEGAIFITDSQLKGRGRRNNKWVDTPNKSLTISFILHPETKWDKLELLSLLTGVSIVQGIKLSTSIQTGLKWPNDIMLYRKKIGGILIESRSISNRLQVVVGIGLNINETMEDFPDFLKFQTTSLSIHSDILYNREKILSAILKEFEQLYVKKWDDIIPIWSKYCIHKDSEVTFHTDKGLYKGIFLGISPIGHAEIHINGGKQTFSSGMIKL